MRTKIIYALVSKLDDLYYEQMILSIYSLRKHNPNAHVTVILDEGTNATLCSRKIKLDSYINELIVAETPSEFTNMQKNRFIKTSLRELVEGDYLYIDSDTIICDSLEELDMLDCELGAVPDAHGYPYPDSVQRYLYEISHAMGWDEILSTTLFNGGMMYSKDTDNAHKFYSLWHTHWLECVEKGNSKDQLSLRKTFHDFPVIQQLDDCWNCMVKDHGVPYLDRAKIIHYFYETANDNYILSSNSLFKTIKECEFIPSFVDWLIESPKRMACSAEQFVFVESSEPIQRLHANNPKMFYWLLKVVNHYFGIKCRLNNTNKSLDN